MEPRETGAPGEIVLLRRAARLLTKPYASAGWITITNRRFVFESPMFNFEDGAVELELRDIRKARKRNWLLFIPQGIKLSDRSGRAYRLALRDRDEVLAVLIERMAAVRSGREPGLWAKNGRMI